MTVVSFPGVTVSFKNALNEILTSYFDGAVHEINDQSLLFPVAKFAYDIRGLDNPQGLVISFIGDSATDYTELKCNNPEVNNSHGVEFRAALSRFVGISAPMHGESNTRKTVELAWDLLFALTTYHGIWAAKGIFRPSLPLLPSDTITTDVSVTAAGSFSCEIRPMAARYNT